MHNAFSVSVPYKQIAAIAATYDVLGRGTKEVHTFDGGDISAKRKKEEVENNFGSIALVLE